MGPCQQGVLKWHSIWSSCQPCQRNCQISTGTAIKSKLSWWSALPLQFVRRTRKSRFQSFPWNVCSTRIASWQTGDQLFMLLMMLGVGRRRWTTRQNILHQASTMKYYNDNVDKPFVKELQTIPHILKLYIWKNSHYTFYRRRTTVGWIQQLVNRLIISPIQTHCIQELCSKGKYVDK